MWPTDELPGSSSQRLGQLNRTSDKPGASRTLRPATGATLDRVGGLGCDPRCSPNVDFERDTGDIQFVTVFHFLFVRDGLLIHKCAILTSQISNSNNTLSMIEQQLAVVPTDNLAAELQIAIGGTTDHIVGMCNTDISRFDNQLRSFMVDKTFERDLHGYSFSGGNLLSRS